MHLFAAPAATSLIRLALTLLMVLLMLPLRAHAQCLADVNNDGKVSPSDFTAWIAAYNLNDPIADQNVDGLITPSDFTAWVANYNAGCDDLLFVQLWKQGANNGIPISFVRGVPARQPDGGDVDINEPRFGEPVLRVPLAKISPLFENAELDSLHLGAGYSSSGTLVQFNNLRDLMSPASVIQATHGMDVTGDPTQDAPPNARRYLQRMRGPARDGDLMTRTVLNDIVTPNAGAYFQDAYVVASTVLRDDVITRSGVIISVGNYTPEEGLSGDGGGGDRLSTVFADIEARTGTENHLREWSVKVFVIDDNEVTFNIVDYTGGSSNPSWAIMIRATRTASGEPWFYGRPCVVFSKTDENLVDHFHHMGSAVQSQAGTTPGALTQIASTGDVIDDQAVYARTIHDPADYDALYATYFYGNWTLELAFAEPPAQNSFLAMLPRLEMKSGVSSWGPERTLFGRRDEDQPESVLPWGAPQYIGCAPGPKRSQLVLGGDRTNSHAIVCYDIDTFDPETESPTPQVWQRWGNTSQFGVALGDNGQSGIMTFRLDTLTPEAPEWYIADISHTNQNGFRTPESIMIGRATIDDRVVFGKVAQDLPAKTLAITADGRTIFAAGNGSRRIDLAVEPTVVRPRLLGAGFLQYQPLFAAGPVPFEPESEAGVDQVKNTEVSELEWRFGVDARYATNADLQELTDNGFSLPGYGPVYVADVNEDAFEPFYLSADGFRTLPLRARFTRQPEDDIWSDFQPIDGQAEAMFAVLPIVDGAARAMPLRFSLGDIGSGNAGVPGLDYNNIAVEGGDWSVFRTLWVDSAITSLSLRISSSSNVDPGQVPLKFFLQVIGLTVADAGAYPMGYAALPHTISTGPTQPVIVGARSMPDENLTLLRAPVSGTVAYHAVNDPHGVDIEYYRILNNLGISADHALLSIVDGTDNFIEVGWANGNFLFVRTARSGVSPSKLFLDTPIGLQRQDDLKVVVRYDTTGTRIDVWHNGNRVSSGLVAEVPEFVNPTIRLGSALKGRTLPVMVHAVGTNQEVLSDEDLIEMLETDALFLGE